MTHRIRNLAAGRRVAAILGTMAGALVVAGTLAASAQTVPPYLSNFPNFARTLTAQMPGDVDVALKTTLEQNGRFAEVQREFDLNAWQMFLALNWPTNNQRQPAPTIRPTGFGAPHWTTWQSSSSIFQDKGAPPAVCGAATAGAPLLALSRDLSKPVSKGLPAFTLQANQTLNPRTTRLLGVISAVGELNVGNIDDIQQAFSGPLVDQFGNFVFYEILIDPNEVKYLCDNKLYSIDGQIAFSNAGKKVDMPSGQENQDWSGSFELKLAWRVMKPCDPAKPDDPCDDMSRFFVADALIMDQGENGQPVQRSVKVGLVGMHIAHKTNISPQWIWATFEQVDNLSVDTVAHPKLHASFNDPNCPLCAVNMQPQPLLGGPANPHKVYSRIPVQVSRTIPIPADKAALNAQAAAVLRSLGSVWQYYQLIDTQWPINPKSPPAASDGGLPDAVANKSGGVPTPVWLTNVTMETYFQAGNQPACRNVEDRPPGCPPVYNKQPPGTAIAAYTPVPAWWNEAFNNGPTPVKPGTTTQILATESCMGCHSSAYINTASGKSVQLSGDFSWLLATKAQ